MWKEESEGGGAGGQTSPLIECTGLPGMRGRGEDKMACSKLLEKTKPLELRSINNSNGNRWELDVTMNAENKNKTIYKMAFKGKSDDEKPGQRSAENWLKYCLYGLLQQSCTAK